MIFWFSGTGNSLWVAREMARLLNERLIDVAQAHREDKHDYTLQPGESVGWVFPVHAWGPPRLVLDFVHKLHLVGYNGSTHCWMTATCGDDVGLTVHIMQQALGDLRLSAAFSVQMPNTYVCLPGFDVDPHDLEQRKLIAAGARIERVAQAIAERRNVIDVVPGGMPWVKSRMLRPAFNAMLMGDSSFLADASCVSCGKCERDCPVGNIKLNDGRPKWQGHCTMCLRCLHTCPTHAIQRGALTRNKGRYHHPDFK